MHQPNWTTEGMMYACSMSLSAHCQVGMIEAHLLFILEMYIIDDLSSLRLFVQVVTVGVQHSKRKKMGIFMTAYLFTVTY